MMKGFALRPPLLKELLRRIEARTCAISVCVDSFAVCRVDKNGYRVLSNYRGETPINYL